MVVTNLLNSGLFIVAHISAVHVSDKAENFFMSLLIEKKKKSWKASATVLADV